MYVCMYVCMHVFMIRNIMKHALQVSVQLIPAILLYSLCLCSPIICCDPISFWNALQPPEHSQAVWFKAVGEQEGEIHKGRLQLHRTV